MWRSSLAGSHQLAGPMRNMNRLLKALVFTVAASCAVHTAKAQVSVNFGTAKLNSISSPFIKPRQLFNGAQKDQDKPLVNIDWGLTFGSDVKKNGHNVDDAGIVQVSDELLLPSELASDADSEVVVLDEAICGDDECDEKENKRRGFWQMSNAPYSVYRSEQENLTWLPGSGDDFGMVDWESDPYLTHDEDRGFSLATNVHWLSGPSIVPLESRVFDFALGYQSRGQFSPSFSYDLSTSVGVYSDFEASAREGVRFPSHAVGMFHCTHGVDFVFGVDYLDRDDISVLPVIGLSLRQLAIDGLRLDLVFPRPRIDYTFNDKHRMYVAGKLGGGSWDVALQGIGHTVATYRDYRVVLGFESTDEDGSLSALEFGYVFDRTLELRGRADDSTFTDAFMINLVTRR